VEPTANPDPLPRTWPVYLATMVLLLGMAVVPFVATPGGLLRAASISAAWTVLFAIVAARAFAPSAIDALGLGPARLSRAGWIAAVAGGLALSQAADFGLRAAGFGRGESLERLISLLSGMRGVPLAVALVSIGLLAGAGEELFFRGFAQRRLATRHGAAVGIALAAALFALAHANPQHSAFAFVFGCYVGVVSHASGSVRPAIAIHVVNNAASVLSSAFGFVAVDASWSRGVLAASAVACTVATLVLLSVVVRSVRVAPAPDVG